MSHSSPEGHGHSALAVPHNPVQPEPRRSTHLSARPTRRENHQDGPEQETRPARMNRTNDKGFGRAAGPDAVAAILPWRLSITLSAEFERLADLRRTVPVQWNGIPRPVLGPHPVVADDLRPTVLLEASGLGGADAMRGPLEAGPLLLLGHDNRWRMASGCGA